MVSTFNITTLKELLKNFYTITHIQITVFDETFQEIVAYPEKIPPFCSIIRTSQIGHENCLACDKAACLKAKETRKVHTYQCHAGLTESIAPIILGNIVIGFLIFGHIAPCADMDQGWRMIRECCKNYPIDLELLESAYADRRYFSDEYISSASEIMNAVASYLCISHMAKLKLDSLPIQIDHYINAHLSEELNNSILCTQFEISRTKLYQISENNFGMGIADYIRKTRISHAAHLLETTSLPINQVASAVGISDYNYFTKVFKKQIGFTPRDYQKQLENHTLSDEASPPRRGMR